MIYRLRIKETHRYSQLPIRTKDGGKVAVTKDKWVDISAEDLADGEEFTIRRYEQENRFEVKLVEEKHRAVPAGTVPKPKRRSKAKPEVAPEPEG